MNRIEFTEKLQRALAGGLNSNQVADHVRYYQEYINGEIQKGRREEDVLAELGDPRLLAKSIIEANKRAGAGEGTNRTYDEEMTGAGNAYRGAAHSSGAQGSGVYNDSRNYDAYENYGGESRIFRMPGWLILLIVTVVVILIIGVAFSLISVLAPIIIPVLIVILLVRIFQGGR
ncbi:MAG: DUF1700 domain-containing protein [Lachnospiraceae bacterium]|nr:DUF1700 domain-containing protein [Lachnospiraceae bacterium]